MKCLWHLCTNEAVRKFCSVNCKTKYHVHQFRRNLKARAVAHMGGKCLVCGYDKCQENLTFHHLDPSQKDFGLGESGHTRSWERVAAELTKCVMLCRNCHGEVHAGLLDLAPHRGVEPR